jgi:hypothetical protein
MRNGMKQSHDSLGFVTLRHLRLFVFNYNRCTPQLADTLAVPSGLQDQALPGRFWLLIKDKITQTIGDDALFPKGKALDNMGVVA